MEQFVRNVNRNFSIQNCSPCIGFVSKLSSISMTSLFFEEVKTSVVTGIIFVSVGVKIFICNKPPLRFARSYKAMELFKDIFRVADLKKFVLRYYCYIFKFGVETAFVAFYAKFTL